MDLLPAGPTGDPLLDAVRRRHPDVDLVVLPPEKSAAPARRADSLTAEALGVAVLAEAQPVLDALRGEC